MYREPPGPVISMAVSNDAFLTVAPTVITTTTTMTRRMSDCAGTPQPMACSLTNESGYFGYALGLQEPFAPEEIGYLFLLYPPQPLVSEVLDESGDGDGFFTDSVVKRESKLNKKRAYITEQRLA